MPPPPSPFLHSLTTCFSKKEADARATANTSPAHPQQREKLEKQPNLGKGLQPGDKLPRRPGYAGPQRVLEFEDRQTTYI